MIVKHYQMMEDSLNNKPFEEGCLYLTEDTHRIYIDPVGGGVRTLISASPIILSTESDRENILAPIPNTIYIVLNTKGIYVYSNGSWYNFNITVDDTLTVSGKAADAKAVTTAINKAVSDLQTALNEKAPSNHGNHVPAIETANNAKFLRNDNTWQTVTPANIGAAAASHGNHVPTTQTANNAKFLRNDNTWQTVTPANIGAAATSHTHNLLCVQSENYKQGTDLPSTYPQGETIFFSNNPTNRFAGIQYCTVHTIKGYTNMAAVQFVYPYNTNADTIYYRTAIYKTNSWRGWKAISHDEHTHYTHNQGDMSNTDLNTIKTAGWYSGYTGMTNAPAQSISVMEVVVYSPDWIMQRFTVINGKEYMRFYHSGTTWSSWNECIRANVGATGNLTINGTITGTKVVGAVWNDYAEFRNQSEDIEPGYCVASSDNGKVYKTTEKYQACDGIVSDTFGFAIDETDDCKTPLAVSGRVLAYCEGNKYDYNSGDTVCAGPDGKVCKMTREEIKEYPDRIVGIVSEIPEYETWGSGNVPVNGRIWIKVK